ncbi:MAG TPA: hypothetical protein EYG86_01980 [Crocinitomicaceae bacterium]|nr:hypothetical protein [Crocinitomicaceae bacterium]
MKLVASIYISPKGVFLNNELQFSLTEENWKKEIYSKLEIDYSKFHKMDALSKMAFLSTETLSNAVNTNKYDDNGMVLLFANASSSQDTDLKYINSYEVKGSPSPSLFVYTLPNILTGELAIRHKWYGENCFYIEEKFDAEFYLEQINFYFSKGAKACLCGWVNSFDGKEECFEFLIENEGNDNKELIKEELIKLYNQ